ncbi:hypothetical protein [Ramlibacter sp. 2FC]|uniref:hypothetical protein n=1 Tax=Ramlibacter sp. 2FC TaxID=2502188 RepID=UPI0010F7780C|nr:hypothetical protein [Ramlibacter sp. 2FC]
MIEQTTPANLSSASALRLAAVRAARANPAAGAALGEERLPFTVRLVRNAADLDKAVAIRHAAYARHVPDLAEKLRAPEAIDFEDGVVVLLAESKLDGSALGTMRIQTNTYKPLSLEESVQLPPWLQGGSLAEAARLGIAGERIGNMVKTVLFKAFFLYCQQAGIDWMVITARAPIDRQYERLLFSDVYPGMGYVPIRCTNDIPHRIMSFEVATAEVRWAAVQHPLFNFIFRTNHPDIDLDPSTAGQAAAMHRSYEAPRGVMYS